MHRCLPLMVLVVIPSIAAPLRADAFDHYTNPILAKAAGTPGVLEVKRLTADLLVEHSRVLPNTSAALLVVHTNDGLYSKLLVEAARHRLADEARTQLPILLIDRFVTYREGTERAVQASGQNVYLFSGFRFRLDIGQVVPKALGGDLRFSAEMNKDNGKREIYVEPVGKAKLYLVTKPLPGAEPKKGTRPVVGEKFEAAYFNGKYKLYDDGRRSGSLELKVQDDGDITGAYYSNKDGRKYGVTGKVGTPKHAIQFTIKFPRTEQSFQGWLFTGDAKAITGSSKIEGREAGFYAVRIEE